MSLVQFPNHHSIEIPLFAHKEARGIDDLWAGKTDIRERRRLQNKLNRRAYRKRQAEQRLLYERHADKTADSQQRRRVGGSKLPGTHVFALEPADGSDSPRAISLKWSVSVSGTSPGRYRDGESLVARRSSGLIDVVHSWCRAFETTVLQSNLNNVELAKLAQGDSAEAKSDAVLLEESLIRSLDMPSPYRLPVDHLLNLVYYNVFRGLSRNTRALHLDIGRMTSREYSSPFLSGGIDATRIAPDFQPTLWQRTIPHHPMFDIFPDPVLRDHAIEFWAQADVPVPEGRFGMALAGRNTWQDVELPLRHGCVLWGEPDRLENWEVTEGFVQTWPCLVKGAFRLEAATNAWRAVRGEDPISFA